MIKAKNYLIISVFLIFIVSIVQVDVAKSFTTVQTSVDSVHSTSEVVVPKLYVLKEVEKDEVALGESFLVTIKIVNYGNGTAYNVTFEETLNPSWIFEPSGLTDVSYPRIEPNETRMFAYKLTAVKLSSENDSWVLHPAKVYYYDSPKEPVMYQTYSNSLSIKVIEPPEDFSIKNFYSAITLIIILIISDSFLLVRIIDPLNRSKNNK